MLEPEERCSLMEQVFLPMGGVLGGCPSAGTGCMVEGDEVRGQRTFYILNFSCLATEDEFYFIPLIQMLQP